MSFDIYSPCPGGLDKKVKFCCKDLVSDLDRISRLIKADQRQAALDHIDRVLVEHPDRQCLWSHKLHLHSSDPTDSRFAEAVDGFLHAAPHNPIALAGAALRFVSTFPDPDEDDDDDGGGDLSRHSLLAAESFQQALSSRGRTLFGMLWQVAALLGQRLFHEGAVLSAREHLRLAMSLAVDKPPEAIVSAYANILRNPGISLLLKSHLPLPAAPQDATWAPDYDAILKKAAVGAWAEAVSRLVRLAEQTPGEPLLRKAIAVLRCWLPDRAKAVKSLRRYAAMDNVPLDDRIDAEALARELAEEIGDGPTRSLLEVTFEIEAPDEVRVALDRHENFVSVPWQESDLELSDGMPPPLAVCRVLDRPMPAADEATLDTTPREIAQLFMFGKESDRTARLLLMVDEGPHHDRSVELLGNAIGSEMQEDPHVETLDEFPADDALFREESCFPDLTTPSQRFAIFHGRNRQLCLEVWPDTKLARLDGRSPREAGADPAYEVKTHAAILALQARQMVGLRHEDYDHLRSLCGLAALAPLAPEEALQHPITRWSRVDPAGLPDEVLAHCLREAMTVSANEVGLAFGKEWLRRPTAADHETLDVSLVCVWLSSQAFDLDESIELLQKGQEILRIKGRSPAQLLIQEAYLRVRRSEPDEFSRVVEQLQKKHLNEPGIREAMRELFIRVGILNPDGTPRAAAQPAVVGGDGGPAAPSADQKIWTPNDQQDDPDSEGESKLWLPGME